MAGEIDNQNQQRVFNPQAQQPVGPTEPAQALPPVQPEAEPQQIRYAAASSQHTPATMPQVPAQPDSNPNQSRPVISRSQIHNDGNAIAWEASEYIHHEKNNRWYLYLVLVGIATTVAMLFLIDIISAVMAALVTAALFIYAKRKPDIQKYTVSSDGVSIGNKDYLYSDFHSFILTSESDTFASIMLVPNRRFAPPINVYFDRNDGDQIVDIISEHLPNEEHKPDLIDQFFAKIRF